MSQVTESGALAEKTTKRNNNLIGQIKNSPDYIALLLLYATFWILKIISRTKKPIRRWYLSGDSDLLVYQMSNTEGEDGVMNINYEAVLSNLNDPTIKEGGYPLLDLRKKYGIIVFQLYAGCLGCDFTECVPSGYTATAFWMSY